MSDLDLPFQYPVRFDGAAGDTGGHDYRDRELEDFLARLAAGPAWVPFTASGTWTRPEGLAYIVTFGVGGGGGSGGSDTTGAAQAAGSGAGGGAGYCYEIIPGSALGDSVTVTVGVGGTAGAAAAGAGGAGGASSFGAFWTANGGAGGAGCGAFATPQASPANGGAGGTATGGDINIPGEAGGGAILFPGRIRRAKGGASQLGNSGDDGQSTTGAGGQAGQLYGAGAGGSFNCQSQGTARAGAVGGDGIVVVKEFTF